MRRWRRQRPVLAGLVVGVAAYVFFALTLSVFGGAEPEQALGPATALGGAVIWFVAWAVFSRSETPRGRGEGDQTPEERDGP